VFALIAVGAFYFAEWVESLQGGGTYLRKPMLKALGLAMIVLAVAMFVLPGNSGATDGQVATGTPVGLEQESQIFASIEQGGDHIDPEELADWLMEGRNDLVVVDIRPAAEYEAFHIRGAINVPLSDLVSRLEPHKNKSTIVIYSTGMTHPAQARDGLTRIGFQNVYLLTDGLAGFVERCLKPVSLRSEPLPPEAVTKVQKWREHFRRPESKGEQATVANR
jgi:thiosulfate/3-mercaptopyruvate sulfurtransferase